MDVWIDEVCAAFEWTHRGCCAIGTTNFETPTGYTYAIDPDGGALFPALCYPSSTRDIAVPRTNHRYCALTMPTRTQTRKHGSQQRITNEREKRRNINGESCRKMKLGSPTVTNLRQFKDSRLETPKNTVGLRGSVIDCFGRGSGGDHEVFDRRRHGCPATVAGLITAPQASAGCIYGGPVLCKCDGPIQPRRQLAALHRGRPVGVDRTCPSRARQAV